jgi:hypothetical protein
VLDEWKEYLQFRKYYLGKQIERCETIDGIEVSDLLITKEAYRRNEERLTSLLLDNVPQFAKGEQVIFLKTSRIGLVSL